MPGSLATVGDLTSRHQMIGRVRRRSCALPSLGDFVRWCSDISRRRSRAPPSLRDIVRWRSDISRRRSCAPPSLRDFVRWRSDISSRLRRGGANRKKKISVQVNLTLIFFFRFAERRRFELLIPFWSIHAFQACLLSHSSISPELPCNTDRTANIRIIC